MESSLNEHVTGTSEMSESLQQQIQSSKISPEQMRQLNAQIAAYKMLARNEPLPRQLLNQANDRKNDSNALPLPYEYPYELPNGEKLPYDLSKILAIHQQRTTNRTTTLPLPQGIDPEIIWRERENRIQNRIALRIKELTELTMDMPPHLRMNAEIELRALRLVNLQTQVRSEVLSYLKRDTYLETALNPYAYRRTKRHTLREARVTEKLEKQQKVEQERRRRQKHSELLQAIVQVSKEFKDFHRNAQAKTTKVRKHMQNWHANSEKERKKDELRNEKMRMQKLMEEDDVGYRQLLDEKKDKRLVYLLAQTDEYVENLTGLVKQHQVTEKKRKRDERSEAKKALKQQQSNNESDELPLIIRNGATGEILRGDAIPKPDEVEEWLASHPGYELISRDIASDSEDEGEEAVETTKNEQKEDDCEGLDDEQRSRRILEKARNEEDEYDSKNQRQQMESYYATAHRIKEKIVKQHSTLGASDPNLQLKPYQVALITYLMEVKKVNGPYLIIVPLSTISNWKIELDKWSPHVVKIIYKGDKDQRKRLEPIVRKGAFNVLLTTYDYVLKERSLLGKEIYNISKMSKTKELGFPGDASKQGGRALMNTVIHLRKLCNHPFLFHSVEDECQSFWKDMQAQDRAHRIGQTREVNICYRYALDLLTDKEWLSQIGERWEDTEDDEDISELIPGKKKKGAGRKKDGTPESGEPAKRGRKRKKAMDEESGAGSGDDSNAGTPGPGRRGVAAKRAKGAKMPPSNPKFTEKLITCLDTLINYKDSRGRELSGPFIQLPSRREYPDYYEQIEHPMDLNRIRRKINDDKYTLLEQMTSDVNLLCDNAQRFNIEGSDIHEDSKLLNIVWHRVVEAVSLQEQQQQKQRQAATATNTIIPIKQQESQPSTSSDTPPVLQPMTGSMEIINDEQASNSASTDETLTNQEKNAK
uniref:Uncharacterized protein n=2 Tax=Meloidogyne TaxID=189290 RepID=A0A915NPB8_9BILA